MFVEICLDLATMTIDSGHNPNAKANRVPLATEVEALRSLVESETNVLEAVDISLLKAHSMAAAAEKRVSDANLELEAAISSLAAARATVNTLESLRKPILRYSLSNCVQ